MMNETLKIIFATVAILAGIASIIIVLGNAEYIIASLSLTFGVLAIIWTLTAHGSLSPGSSLRSYTAYFLACLVFVLIYSVWNNAITIFNITGYLSYLEYLFVTIAYLLFVSAAYKIYSIGKEFGFQKEAGKIKMVMEKKKNRR
ncbi:MAG TPA: hypothetical protein VJC00_02640 [Candidatus Nanoarchaeia archaeon]|nr:hypothetical protein [Candidatus Nanoarchaeia archaeon]